MVLHTSIVVGVDFDDQIKPTQYITTLTEEVPASLSSSPSLSIYVSKCHCRASLKQEQHSLTALVAECPQLCGRPLQPPVLKEMPWKEPTEWFQHGTEASYCWVRLQTPLVNSLVFTMHLVCTLLINYSMLRKSTKITLHMALNYAEFGNFHCKSLDLRELKPSG